MLQLIVSKREEKGETKVELQDYRPVPTQAEVKQQDHGPGGPTSD
jgi:hypothetical protein